MKTEPLSEYLSDGRSRHKTVALTPETSLYQPLETLLSAVGATLKPKVRCFMNMKNQGSGMPDGGHFTPDQFDKDAADAPDGQKPARGVIVCKKPPDEVSHTLESEQVSQYWSEYQLVLVTNYRDFALLGTGPGPLPPDRRVLHARRQGREILVAPRRRDRGRARRCAPAGLAARAAAARGGDRLAQSAALGR